MTDITTPSGPEKPAETDPPKPIFPDINFPVGFIDGIMSLALGPQVVKFYAYRANPNILGLGGVQSIPVAQVVMPINGFIDTTIFFLRQLGKMEAEGSLPIALSKDLRKICREIADAVDGRLV